MSRLQVRDDRIEWADTEQMIEFTRNANDIDIYMERESEIDSWDTDSLTISIPVGDFLHLISELRKKFS